MTLKELVDQSYGNSKAHGFHDNEEWIRIVPEKLMLIVSELSEALEHYRNGNNQQPLNVIFADLTSPSRSKPDGFAIELADAIIRIGDLCGQLNIDLEEAVRIKMVYNATRPFKHGGKKC